MTFEISQIVNKYLLDVALISDNNNDSIINDAESSIFLQKSKRLVQAGLVTQDEYDEISKYCMHDQYIACRKVQVEPQEGLHNEIAQQKYQEDLNKLVLEELNARGLEENADNKVQVLEIIKQKKEIEIEIKILEKKNDELKNKNPKDKYDNRTKICEDIGGTLGGLGGIASCIYAGTKLGIIGGSIGVAIGAVAGAVVGMCVGIYAGHKIGDSLITDEEIKTSQDEIQKLIKENEQKIQELKQQLNNL